MISNKRIQELLLEYKANTLEELIEIMDKRVEELTKHSILLSGRFLQEI